MRERGEREGGMGRELKAAYIPTYTGTPILRTCAHV